MKRHVSRSNKLLFLLLYWSPRVLALGFSLFLSLFALDVFSEPNWGLGLIMHLLPSLVILALTAIAWKWARVGGGLFLVTSMLMGLFFHSVWLAAPVAVVGGLFWVSGLNRLKSAK